MNEEIIHSEASLRLCNCPNCKENKENLNCILEHFCIKCNEVYLKEKCFSEKGNNLIRQYKICDECLLFDF